MKTKQTNPLCRQVVIALKGGGGSGKTSSLRKLSENMIRAGAVLVCCDKPESKNQRRCFFVYKRWRIVICEGGDTESIILDNFAWADGLTRLVIDKRKNKNGSDSPKWDIIVMPAWIGMYTRNQKYLQGCVGALLHEVWDKKYALEIVDRDPVPSRVPSAEKTKSQADCAKRLKQRIDFLIADRFTY